MPTVDLTRIGSNIGALYSLQSLLDINNKLAAAQSRLSTGKRINSAEDDPAGLVIATKMNARSQGLKVAMDNISDAKNMMSVAEAGLSSITDILTSMRNKATQAASDTLGGTERATIQTQLSQFANQIDDIVSQTKWNGVQLLSGSLAKQFQTGVEQGETTTWNLNTKHDPTSLGVSTNVTSDSANNIVSPNNGLTGAGWNSLFSNDTKLASGTYYLNYDHVAQGATQGTIHDAVDQTSETGTTSLSFFANATAGTTSELSNGGHTVTLNGVTYGAASSTLSYNVDGLNYTTALNATSGSYALTGVGGLDTGISVYANGAITGTAMSAASGTYQFDYVKKNQAEVQLQYADGTNVSVDADGLSNTSTMASTFYMTASTTYNTGRGLTLTPGNLTQMQASNNNGATNLTNRDSFSWAAANKYSVDVSSAAKASSYMSTLDNAMDIVNNSMANLGSIMARMDIKSSVASSAQINVESAYNRIMNADMAEEQVNASKYQVLQQTAVAMLAQSNTAPQALLTLFK
jgi:flagellin